MPEWSPTRQCDRQSGLDLVEQIDELLPGPLGGRLSLVQQLQDLGQRGTSQEGHAEELQVAGLEHMLGVERYYVHVL